MPFLSVFRRPKYIYDRLSNGSDDSQDSPTDDKAQNDKLSREKSPESSMVFYLTLFCVLCTLANLIILRVEEYRTLHPADLSNLRRPTQFVGLDRVKRPFPPEDRSIVNFPFIVGLVDQSRPHSIVLNTRQDLKTDRDIRPPEARQIQISTVVQFRTLDWGMESCVLTLRLPSDESFVRSNSSLSLGNGLNDVDIYRLVSNPGSSSLDTVISQHKLTYQNRPALGEKVGTVTADYGTEWTHQFPCAIDSLHAFALVAADDSARIEWWQDKQTLEPALFISQHATK
ncbi:unnamed protein product [Somion occarium]|uniref:Ubiquitin 3 binding protein But2 C-terminal domain-containing protein n=1 Tax=Somion occarium TaxID=3059160 RepID=A0ABP1CPK7_9APHY